MESLKIYFKKVSALDHYSWCALTVFMEFLSLKADFIDCHLLETYVLKSTANNYLFKANNKSTRTSCKLCSKLTTKTSGRCHCSRSDVFIFNFEHEIQYIEITVPYKHGGFIG